MNGQKPGHTMRPKLAPILFIASMIVTTSACTGGIMDPEPPEAVYTEAEAFAPMEAEVAEIVAALPDFPGFYYRSWNEMPCSHEGVDNGDYVNIEIRYGFDDADSATTTVRDTYVDELRQRWTDLGYDIHRDEPSGTGKFYSLEARRDDGINLWYSVATKVALLVQSGCVPKSDPSEIEYIAPAGGLVPGSQWDTVDIEGVQGIPDSSSEEATSPFDESESPSPPGMAPWARESDLSEMSPSSYEGLLLHNPAAARRFDEPYPDQRADHWDPFARNSPRMLHGRTAPRSGFRTGRGVRPNGTSRCRRRQRSAGLPRIR